ncbi:MAG TPA: methionyl-tRNA formyltransferase [Solirubrobacteraceae bacterium]|nr:methionyl-tRNA formyltransferase [Solirubrobacteraceae bacterium]
MGIAPALAVGYTEDRAGASGYADLGPVCERYGVDLVRAAKVNDDALVARITAIAPAIVWVIGWSQLIRRPLLEVPEHGCVGIHPTDLPDGRGRAPIPWTILKGYARTACTMFFLTEGVDDGDVIGKVHFDVSPREDAGSLYAKHRSAHVDLVRVHARDLLGGRAVRYPQDHARATEWPVRRPEDGRIDWSQPADRVDRLVRAVTRPFPGAFSESANGRVTIWRAEVADDLAQAPGAPSPAPGTVLADAGGVVVACGSGSLRVLEADGLDDRPALLA